MKSTRYSCQILMKLEIFRQVFEKYSNIKFHGKPSYGRRVVRCRQADGLIGYDESNIRFSQILRTRLEA